MTPALKAMVEAMTAELERQQEAHGYLCDRCATPLIDDYDLEKVARAGLEAIRDPGEPASSAGKYTLKGAADLVERSQAEAVFRSMVDAIIAAAK